MNGVHVSDDFYLTLLFRFIGLLLESQENEAELKKPSSWQ